jgi:hypothetical protein
MDEDEVISILGPPDSIAKGDEHRNFWKRDDFSITVWYERGVLLQGQAEFGKENRPKIEVK